MSLTHFNGQKLVLCPECDGTIRLKALRTWDGEEREVHCDRCGNNFTATEEDIL